MLEALLAYFERSFKPSEEEIALILETVHPRIFKKGEFLQREEDIARYGAFVVSGYSLQ